MTSHSVVVMTTKGRRPGLLPLGVPRYNMRCTETTRSSLTINAVIILCIITNTDKYITYIELDIDFFLSSFELKKTNEWGRQIVNQSLWEAQRLYILWDVCYNSKVWRKQAATEDMCVCVCVCVWEREVCYSPWSEGSHMLDLWSWAITLAEKDQSS